MKVFRYIGYRVFFGLIINVFLNFYLIPSYGITGAAMATLVSQFIASYLGNTLVGSTRKIFYVQSRVLLFINFMQLPMRLKNLSKLLKEIA
jgi:Na+-driven multidrug efflux pump